MSQTNAKWFETFKASRSIKNTYASQKSMPKNIHCQIIKLYFSNISSTRCQQPNWHERFGVLSNCISVTSHPLVVSSLIDKKGSEFMRRSMRWEAPSMPTSAHDPGLLREQETPLVIGKNWFLDQEIPAGGFVRIQDSSQVWEERVDETRTITTEGLTTWKTQDEDAQSLAGDGSFSKSRSVGKAASKRWLQLFGKRQNKQESGRKLDTDHQRGQYYKHCSRSIVPRELKKR